MNNHYDVVIIGAGMVGASLAMALLNREAVKPLRIALVEPNRLNTSDTLNYQPSFDARSTALAYGSALIYQQLGIWEHLKEKAQAIEHIHVSDRGHFGATRLHATEEKVAALGYVVENKWLGDVLHYHLQRHERKEQLSYLCPAQVEQVTKTSSLMQLELSAEGKAIQLTAELVVMADGGRSTLREKLGISYTEQNYQQHALVANVALDRPHNAIAFERFTESGPMALLPLPSQDKKPRAALVWTIPEAEIESMLAVSDDDFLSQLQQRFGYRAGLFSKVGQRYSYPLKLQRAKEQVRPGLVVVGNAAHALHPIAGQGFNLALRGVAALAEQVFKARSDGRSLGDYNMLYQYQESRLNDQAATIGFSDKSMRLFSVDNFLVECGRDAALQVMDICPPLKTVFARSAMGLASTAARLK